MLHINLKEITNAAAWLHLYLHADHPQPQVCWWGRNSTYSVRGHIAYQTKRNSDCSYVEANICPAASP